MEMSKQFSFKKKKKQNHRGTLCCEVHIRCAIDNFHSGFPYIGTHDKKQNDFFSFALNAWICSTKIVCSQFRTIIIMFKFRSEIVKYNKTRNDHLRLHTINVHRDECGVKMIFHVKELKISKSFQSATVCHSISQIIA